MRQPVLFIPHGGGPCFFMDWTKMGGKKDEWDRTAAWLRGIDATLPQSPKALLVVSAHWEQLVPTIQTNAQPPLLFDYSGFPPHTYELSWPARGAPDVASRVTGLLSAAGIETGTDAERGFDHGVFVPMLLSYPDANVPTLQLSLRADLDPAAHLAIGRALEPLRDEGVFIIGSGMSYHAMRHFGTAQALPVSTTFDEWLSETVALPASARDARLTRWADAPAGRESHPREEHLLPLMVVAGAAGDDLGEVDFTDVVMGAKVSAIRFGRLG